MAQIGTSNEDWPIAAFFFDVLIDAGHVTGQISCQEVSGLDYEAEVIEYRHGDAVDFGKIKTLGLTKNPNLTLKKAVFRNYPEMFDLFAPVYNDKGYYSQDVSGRLDMTITLYDELQAAVITWNIFRAIPVKFTGVTLKSDGNEAAMESIEFGYEKLTTSFDGATAINQ